SSLRNAVRMMMTLGEQEGIADKVRIVINRVDSSLGEAAISLKKAEETIGKPIYWQIPNDAKAVMSARVAGESLLQHAPKCRPQVSLQGLAAALGNQNIAGGNIPGPPPSSSFMKGIFGKK